MARDLSLAVKINALVKGVKEIEQLADEIKGLSGQAKKPIPDPTTELRQGIGKTQSAMQELANTMGGLLTLAGIQRFVSGAVQEFARAEAGFRGLEAVANAAGVGIGAAMAEAERLAADGLITTQDAAKGLQNLLARGYNLEDAIQTLTRLKDAAAFNRAAHLSMGEAIVTASEGLKNENSILVDNAGVTKNVSVLWKEYAEQIGKSVTELTQQEKIQAEVNGILRETDAQAGNAAEAANSLQGQMARLDTESRKLKASLGETLLPAMQALTQAGVYLLENFFKPFIFLAQAAGVRAGQLGMLLSRLLDLVRTRDKAGFLAGLRSDAELAEKQLTRLAGLLASGKLSIAPSGEARRGASGATVTAPTRADSAKRRQDAQRAEREAQRRAIEEQARAFEAAMDLEDYRIAQETKLALAIKEKSDADARAADAVRDLIDPTREYLRQLAEVNRLVEAGAISQDEGFIRSAQIQDSLDALGKVNDKIEEGKTLAEELGLTFASAFEDAITQGAKFSDLLRGIYQDLLRIAARKLVTEPLLKGFSSIFAGVFHGGGVVGAGGTLRAVNPLAFLGAPRYHFGGLAGNEMPAILQRGEEVLTRSDPRHQANGGGVSVVVNINNPQDAASFRRSSGQISAAVGDAVRQGMRYR